MSDLQRYVQERAARDPEFAEGLEEGYTDFKIGVLLRQARERAGLTQGEVAERMATLLAPRDQCPPTHDIYASSRATRRSKPSETTA
jgi:hypothetical protein